MHASVKRWRLARIAAAHPEFTHLVNTTTLTNGDSRAILDTAVVDLTVVPQKVIKGDSKMFSKVF